MILGEVRRYLRDNNSIRVSRSLRDTAYKAIYAREGLTRKNSREPTLTEIAEERKDVIKVGKVNVDEEPELAAKFGIMSIPAVLLFKKGEVVANSVGYVPKEALNAFVSANI